MEYAISALTLLSTILGLPSALISIADKFSGWMEESEYQRDTEFMHQTLMEDFFIVQRRSEARLKEYIDSIASDTEKSDYMNLFKKLRSDDAIYSFKNRPYRDYLSEDSFGYLITKMKVVQNEYEHNRKAAELEKMYTGFFFEEMAHFEELGRWYDYAISRNLVEKAEKIQEELALCNDKIDCLLNSTSSIQTSVSETTKSISEENHMIQEIMRIFDNVLCYVALAIVGTGVVFLFGVLVGMKLETMYLFGIPICLLLSDVLVVRVFRKKSSDNKYFPRRVASFLRHGFLFVLIPTFLQTIIASTLVFVVSEVFSDIKDGNFAFWILALFLGTLTIQIVRSIKILKFCKVV